MNQPKISTDESLYNVLVVRANGTTTSNQVANYGSAGAYEEALTWIVTQLNATSMGAEVRAAYVSDGVELEQIDLTLLET